MIKLAILLRLIASLVDLAGRASAAGTDVTAADVDAAFKDADLADARWQSMLPKERTSEVGSRMSTSDARPLTSAPEQGPQLP
jgi:hypothetical protein